MNQYSWMRFAPAVFAAISAFLGAAPNRAIAQESSPERRVPLFTGLGNFGRPVVTSSSSAQKYFNQGLSFLYAFNHDEAIRSFREAARIDPGCAMVWWGIALANGPHINNPLVPPERAKAAWQALQHAQQAAAGGLDVERDLVTALATRYADPQPDDRKPLDEAFAAAMRKLFEKYPRDADIGALFAESLMDLRPWDLWTPDGQPQPGTEEVVATLERVQKLNPNHPLALHLYIHAVEASPNPARASSAADRLRTLQPGLGHLVHMPTHIDVRLGNWQQSIDSNALAAEADRRYREQSPQQDFYRIYMAHNHHMLAYSAMMCGQSRRAIDAINEMAGGIPADWLQANAALADGFTAMPLEVLVRFGRWDEVLAAPEPPPLFPIARTLRHCSRGIALAAKGDVPAAKQARHEFDEALKQVPAEAAFGNNKAHDILAVARHLLAAEVLYREGQIEEAFAAFARAVQAEDQLRYSEPPDWIHPVRHALGATLLKERRAAEAERVYREDLARQPQNGWSLYGLAEALRLQGKAREAAAAERAFQEAWRNADIAITSSCFCQPAR